MRRLAHLSTQVATVSVLVGVLAQPAAAQSPDEVRYYHSDAVGTVRVITDDTGTVQARYDYQPFGKRWPSSDPADPRMFAGKERDPDTGLDYFGARYFSGETGRFTTVDPVFTWQENLVDPQRWNRYAYVRNNPQRFTDPDGRAIETLWDALNVGLGAASFVANLRAGNLGGAALDAAGLVYDIAATAVPVLPGGAGTVIRAGRAADRVRDAASVAENGASFGRRGVDFIVTEAGEAIPIPKAAVGPRATENGKGFVFDGGSGGHGLDPRTSSVRIMDPVGPKGNAPAYPGGYVTYGNKAGQGVNPYTGRTVPNSDPSRHIPLKPKPKDPYEPK